LHHYGTRQRLMGAAVEHLAARRLEWVRENAARLPDDDSRPRRALDLLAEALSGPLYAATLELYVAARVDTELHEALVPVEQQLTRELRRLCREYVTGDAVLVQLTLDLLLGRGVGSLLSPVRPGRQRQLLDAWADVVSAGAGR
jgi:AcrR family transcriptional regulator